MMRMQEEREKREAGEVAHQEAMEEQAERYRLQVAKVQNELDAEHANNQVRTDNLLPLLNTHVSTLSFALYSPPALIAQD